MHKPREYKIQPGVTYFHVANLPPRHWNIVKKWRADHQLSARQVVILALEFLEAKRDPENGLKKVKDVYPEGGTRFSGSPWE